MATHANVDPDWSTRTDVDGRMLPPWVVEIVEAACDRFRACADPAGASDRSGDVADAVDGIARSHAADVGRIVGQHRAAVHEVPVVDGWAVDICVRAWDEDSVWPRVYRADRPGVWWPGGADGWTLQVDGRV